MTETKKSNYARTSISLSETVNKWAEEMSDKKGFDNFSAYVADLIRKDKEADDEKALRLFEMRKAEAAKKESGSVVEVKNREANRLIAAKQNKPQ